ncbi:MAG: WhiB family transcriptional regulator [Micrococcaceae bacterium]
MNSSAKRSYEQDLKKKSKLNANDVPSDWFLDPANPDVSAVVSQKDTLENQATSFLSAHEVQETKDLVQPKVEKLQPQKTRQDKAKHANNMLKAIHGLDDLSELSWQDDALCAQTDPEAFFPEKGGSTRDAKKVCNSCTVKAQCLEYALANDERFGIWGGLSERERRRLRKRSL